MIVKTREDFDKALEAITPIIVFDTETSGLDMWRTDHIAGIGFCTTNMETFYLPFRHKDPRGQKLVKGSTTFHLPLVPDNLPIEWMQEFWRKIEDCDAIIGHNLKFDLTGAYKDGFRLKDKTRCEDTIVLSRLRFCGKYDELDLETVCHKILKGPDGKPLDTHKWKQDFIAYLKALKVYPHYDCGAIDIVGKYCENDCYHTAMLYRSLLTYVKQTNQCDIWEEETALLKIVWEQIEKEGMFCDIEYLKSKIPLLESHIEFLSKTILDIFKYEFDINSTQQLKKAMNSIGVSSNLFTDKGNEKWNIEVLLNIDNPVAKLVLQYREAYKMLHTYFLPYLNWNGLIHPSYKTWGTATGRQSCAQPNLQNVMTKLIDTSGEKLDPKVAEALRTMSSSGSVSSRWVSRLQKFSDTDTTVAVKKLFVAPEEFEMWTADYHQQEMRIFSHYMNDEIILNKLEQEGFDFHSMVAEEVWQANEDDSNWNFFRSLAKAVNFGMVYGIGIAKLSKQIGKPEEETRTYKDQYFNRLPIALEFMEGVKSKIRTTGYITNHFGRRYRIASDKAYTGINYLCQGGGADLVKNRMIALASFFKDNNMKSRMVGQVHDELLFYFHKDEFKEFDLLRNVKQIMEKRFFRVHTPIDFSRCNPSWSQKVKICNKCFQDKIENKEEKIYHICQQNGETGETI